MVMRFDFDIQNAKALKFLALLCFLKLSKQLREGLSVFPSCCCSAIEGMGWKCFPLLQLLFDDYCSLPELLLVSDDFEILFWYSDCKYFQKKILLISALASVCNWGRGYGVFPSCYWPAIEGMGKEVFPSCGCLMISWLTFSWFDISDFFSFAYWSSGVNYYLRNEDHTDADFLVYKGIKRLQRMWLCSFPLTWGCALGFPSMLQIETWMNVVSTAPLYSLHLPHCVLFGEPLLHSEVVVLEVGGSYEGVVGQHKVAAGTNSMRQWKWSRV